MHINSVCKKENEERMAPTYGHSTYHFMLLWLLWIHIKGFAGVEGTKIARYPSAGHIYRTWSEWTSWSTCSRTCGGGVSMRTRVCRMRLVAQTASLPKTCLGETTEYQLCETQSCSPYSDDFRSYQCSLRNGHQVAGRIIKQWVPYDHVAVNHCELQCRDAESHLPYSFGKALDGTHCSSNGPAICVNGRCTEIDCAGQLGSDNRMDMCGVCRGDNSTCVHYKNIYWGHQRQASNNGMDSAQDGHFDYNQITVIPSGAMHVAVREESETNFLVLLDHRGKFLINGNWRVGSPGQVEGANTNFIYSRTWDGNESLIASGPTRNNLFVLVLGSGDIPTVHYEYWLSKSRYPPVGTATDPTSRQEEIIRSKERDARAKESQTLLRLSSLGKYASLNQIANPVAKYHGYRSYYQSRNDIVKPERYINLKTYDLLRTNGTNFVTGSSHNKQINVPKSVEPTVQPNVQNKTLKVSNSLALMPLLETKYPSDIEKHGLASTKPLFDFITTTEKPKAITSNTEKQWTSSGRPNHTSELLSEKKSELLYSVINGLPTFTYREENKHDSKQRTDEGDLETKTPSSPHRREEKKRKTSKRKRKRKANKSQCPPCPRVKHQTKNFCLSDFVLRAVILTSETHNGEIRHELEVIQSYKNMVPILPREYLWTPDTCRCPRLRSGREYILMGHSGSAKSRRETRLIIDPNSFVRRYSRKRSATMMRLARDQISICRRKS